MCSLEKLELILEKNKCTAVGVKYLVEGLSNLKGLTSFHINLGYNLIEDSGILDICEFIDQQVDLKSLHLNFVSVKGTHVGLEAIVNSLN